MKPSSAAEAAVSEDDRAAEGRADRRAAKVSRIAVLAAREALADAGVPVGADGIGVVVGSGAGGIDVAERQYGDFFSSDYHRVSPYAIPVSIVGIVSSEISIALGLRGPSHVLSTGCTSSTDAIGYAASLIRQGEADVVVTGGADACATPGMLFGFGRMRATSTHFNDRPAESSRPFDCHRDGFVLGEGAWILVLERLERARGSRRKSLRGGRILRVHVRCLPSRADGSRRGRDRPLHGTGACARGPVARVHRLRQLSRHVDGAERSRRIPMRADDVRPARGAASPGRPSSR